VKIYLENTQHKKGLVEWLKLMECLPSEFEALISNPSTTTKKKRDEVQVHCTISPVTRQVMGKSKSALNLPQE
jgi:hypothetical protein